MGRWRKIGCAAIGRVACVGQNRGVPGGNRDARGTWLIDVTELDEAKEGAVTKVDFAMAPPRIAPSDYRDGNELTTKAGSRRHDAGHYPWQILRYDVDFFFPSALLSIHPLIISSSFPSARCIIPRQSRRHRSAKMNFCLVTDFCVIWRL